MKRGLLVFVCFEHHLSWVVIVSIIRLLETLGIGKIVRFHKGIF